MSSETVASVLSSEGDAFSSAAALALPRSPLVFSVSPASLSPSRPRPARSRKETAAFVRGLL